MWSNGVHGPVGLASTRDRAYLAWDDSRNATGESKAQDVYFTRVAPDGRSLAAVGTSSSDENKLPWVGLGLAIGLGLCGAALLLAQSRAT